MTQIIIMILDIALMAGGGFCFLVGLNAGADKIYDKGAYYLVLAIIAVILGKW